MRISWILNTITDQISNSLNFVNTASELWKELQEQYSQLDGHRIYQLSNEISQLKQNQCTIEVCYYKLKGYWDEIDAIEAPYICTCICNCGNGKLNVERDQRKRLMQFLMGLDECYSNIRGQILIMQPLPNVNKAYGMIRQEERQREATIVKPSISAALSAQTYYNNGNNNSNNSRWNPKRTSAPAGQQERKSNFKKGVFCGNYGLEGHQNEECYKIVGYPVGHPLHDKYIPPNKATPQHNAPTKSINMVIVNDNGNKLMMNARMDQLQNQLNQLMIMMQNTQKDTEPGTFANMSAGTHKLIASHISSQKYRFIASLIAHVKNAWVVDSGATNHISTSLTNMHNIHKNHTPILVTLPNGHNTSVTTVGSVTINPNITLHDVFYVPSFSYNLPVRKLGRHIPLSILFTPLSCYFQDHNRRIAHGTLCNGLYVIHQQHNPQTHSSINQLSTITVADDTTLWHSRLGHPSFQLMKSIKHLNSVIKCN
ncbi:uncharacterized protein [Rutidosis leptorrhynchoides]|uniref:uncharacterized protein n=1 Tax=Rutidosis leptorrhynchoides TaxID=125765 RepID=UPI003A992FC7